jgi:hypothetical protein
MIGVGDGGFSGMIPCLRRISFLVPSARRLDLGLELPFGVGVWIVHGNVHGCGILRRNGIR